MKHNSRYANKLNRRRSAGLVHFQFTVDAQGQMTLNPQHMVYENGSPKTRSFSRLRRSDEV